MTDLTNNQLVAFACMLAEHETPTWAHASCEPCLPETLNIMKIRYASTYNPVRCAKYVNDIVPGRVCCDSAGILRAFFWSNGGHCIRKYLQGGQKPGVQWQAHGFPDTDAIGLAALFKKLDPSRRSTNMRDMPDMPGVIVFRKNTLGIYVGGGYVVTAIKFPGTVAKVLLARNDWISWSYIPFRFMRYVNAQSNHEAGQGLQIYSASVKMADIKKKLCALGYYGNQRCTNENLLFDRETQEAVMALQEDLGHEPTGIIDRQLMSELEHEYTNSI